MITEVFKNVTINAQRGRIRNHTNIRQLETHFRSSGVGSHREPMNGK